MSKADSVRTWRTLTRRTAAPDASKPGLLMARQTSWTIVLQESLEPCVAKQVAPHRFVEIRAVSLAAPTFSIVAVGIGRKENPSWLEARLQLRKHARQFLTRYMEQTGVRKRPIKRLIGQVQFEKVLMPHLGFTEPSGVFHESSAAVQTHGLVPEPLERKQVASWAASEVENAMWPRSAQSVEQCLEILLDVVIARALPKSVGPRLIVAQRAC